MVVRSRCHIWRVLVQRHVYFLRIPAVGIGLVTGTHYRSPDCRHAAALDICYTLIRAKLTFQMHLSQERCLSGG